jgi:hypothetical protein
VCDVCAWGVFLWGVCLGCGGVCGVSVECFCGVCVWGVACGVCVVVNIITAAKITCSSTSGRHSVFRVRTGMLTS